MRLHVLIFIAECARRMSRPSLKEFIMEFYHNGEMSWDELEFCFTQYKLRDE